MTRASLRFWALSSTIRIGSPAMDASSVGRRERQQAMHRLQERVPSVSALRDDLGSPRFQTPALLDVEVLHGPDDNRQLASGRKRPEAYDEFQPVDVRHQEVDDHQR